MSALRAALLEWNINRVASVLVAGGVTYVSMRVTDGFYAGLALTVLLAVAVVGAWTIGTRIVDSSRRD